MSGAQHTFVTATRRQSAPPIGLEVQRSSRGAPGLRTLPPDPSEPYLDVVFVHSLLGDSRSSWTIADDIATFWPEWLSDHTDFAKTRIHVYGYECPLEDGRVAVSKTSELGINLCSALESHHSLRRDAHNPIIFVAHSLGGLVVKAVRSLVVSVYGDFAETEQAITYAKSSSRFERLGQRMRAVVFFATPHREAENHAILVHILNRCDTSVSSDKESQRPEPNSTSLREINYEFQRYAQGLQIWCFYENVADPVVPQKYATLLDATNLPANAWHENTIRFSAASDPTFMKVEEILRGQAKDVRQQLERPEIVASHLRIISKSLNVTESTIVDVMQADLDRIVRDKVDGTCEWLLQKAEFKAWSGLEPASPSRTKAAQIYLLQGNPGCGKSFLTAHIIRHLQQRGLDISFYFVKRGNSVKQNMTNVLKSIALQMAKGSANFRRSLLSMSNENVTTADFIAYNYDSGNQIWEFPTKAIILALAIVQDDSQITLLNINKEVESRDIVTGSLLETRSLRYSEHLWGRKPQMAYICEDMDLIVLVFRNEQAEMYDFHTLHQPSGRINHTTNVECMAFNPAKGMLAIASFDGEVVIVSAQTLEVDCSISNCDAAHMAVSPDGKILAIATKQGAIKIFEFDGLDLRYTISFSTEERIESMCFTHSNVRFLDIRTNQFNIWEPAALFRREEDESGSSGGVSQFTSAPSQSQELSARSDKSTIIAVVEHHSGDYVFCAKESGTVAVYETSRGKAKKELFQSRVTRVVLLAWNKTHNILASADSSDKVRLHRIRATSERGQEGSREPSEVRELKGFRSENPVQQMLFSQDEDLLVVSTTEHDLLFRSADMEKIATYACPSAPQRFARWAICARTPKKLYEISETSARTISWHTRNSDLPVVEDSNLNVRTKEPLQHSATRLYLWPDHLWILYSHKSSSTPISWTGRGTAESHANAEEQMFLAHFNETIAPHISSLLGIYKDRLVFLDSYNWVRSFDVGSLSLSEQPVRYFPIPHYWTSHAAQNSLAFVRSKGYVVVPGGEGSLTIVKNPF